MAQALPIDLLIDITSVGVKDTFTIGKLNTILITKYNDNLPNPKFNDVFDLDTAQVLFGFNSDVAKFAGIYFGFVSKTASKCDYLAVYNWNNQATPAILKGGRAPSLSELKLINGKFKLELGGVSENISLDLSEATSLNDVANKIQLAISSVESQSDNANFTNAEVIFSNVTNGFIIKGGQKGRGEEISFLQSPDDGVDIHNLLGLTQAQGASIIEGLNQVENISEVLNEIDKNNGNYYVITPNFEFDNLQDLADFGTFLKNSNDRFMGVYSWDNIQLGTLNSNVTKPYEAYDGLLIDYKKQDYQNAYVCSLVSAMDLSKIGGNYNLAFNDATLFQVESIIDKIEYNAMIQNKANAPCKFGILGQDDTIYMDGTILGVKTNSANVYLCNSFLKFSQQTALYNMLKSQKLIGLRDKNSQTTIISYLNDVFQSAVNANIIAVGAKLTNTEKQTIISTFGALVNDIEEVFNQLENGGFYYCIKDLNVTTRELTIAEAYVANVPVKKIIINNYILGA